MARFSGLIGFVTTVDAGNGVYNEVIDCERMYYGDLLHDNRKWFGGTSINDNLEVSNVVSIMADPFILSHQSCIRYVIVWGSKWKVNTIEINRPRMTLYLGGLYNATENATP